MSSAPTAQANDKPHEPSILAAFLSYLIPGLGQIYQGRYGKGVLFMVSLLGMFFLGQAMGKWQNVYIHALDLGPNRPGRGGAAALVNRWHYGGQFWIGIAAWPALWQHFEMPLPNKEQYGTFVHDFQAEPRESDVNTFLVNSDKTPDLGWVYTVVAGMLNILVIYDAYAGPVFIPIPRPTSKETAVPEQTQAKKEGVA
jgi:hypothetical protein